MEKKVLIIDDMHESISPMLRDIGFDPDYKPEITRSEILSIIADYDAIIVRSKTTVDKELIDAAKRLKVVARAGAGIDKLDVDYLAEKNIKIINAPEGNRDAVAEHTLGMLLALNIQLVKANSQVRSYTWNREDNRGYEIKGKTVGIFGYGFMGQAFSKRLRGFECEVIAYDKYKTSFGNEYVQEVSLRDFLDKTEILSIHVPLTIETKMLFNSTFFDKFKQLRIVINTSRGEILKLEDLCEILESGGLDGACLDVLENEKIDKLSKDELHIFKRLTELPNVLLSPHVAGWTYESYRRINEVIVDKLRQLRL